MKKVVLVLWLFASLIKPTYAISDVVIADACGAFFGSLAGGPIGAAVGAVGASIAVCVKEGATPKPMPTNPEPVFYTTFANVGEMHNNACIGILKTKQSPTDIPTSVADYFRKTYSYTVSKDAVKTNNDIIIKCLASNDYSEIFKNFRNNEIRKIGISFYQGLKKVDSKDLYAYIAKTDEKLKNVKGANRDEMSKLQCSMTILQYSNALWASPR